MAEVPYEEALKRFEELQAKRVEEAQPVDIETTELLTRRERLLPNVTVKVSYPGIKEGAEQLAEGTSLIGDMVDDLMDMPSRISKLVEYGTFGMAYISGLSPNKPSDVMSEEDRKKALGGAVDVALMAIPGGKITKAAEEPLKALFAKELVESASKWLLRPAIMGAKAGALFPEKEKASTVEGRLESAAIGAATGVVFEPATVLATKGLNAAAKKASGIIFKRAPVAAEQAAMREAEKEASKIIANKSVTEISEQEVPRIVSSLDETQKKLSARAEEIFNNQLDKIEQTGTIQPKAKRPQITKLNGTIEGAETTQISPEELMNVKTELVSVGAQLKAVTKKLAEETTDEMSEQYRLLYDRFVQLEKEFFVGRRAAGLSLRTFQQGLHELEEIGIGLSNMKAVQKGPVVQELINRIRTQGLDGVFSKLTIKDITQMWRVGIFPILSAARDSFTNAMAMTSHANQGFMADIFDNYAGKSGLPRTKALFLSLGRTGRMPKSVRDLADPVAMSERLQTIFSKKIDSVLYLPAKMKRGVDVQFQKWGAMSSLYEDAIKLGQEKGLRGTDLTDFVRTWVMDPPEEALNKAGKAAATFGFNLQMNKGVEKFAASPWTKLFVNPFMRWTFQFTKFLSEHTPVSTEFWKKAAKGAATEEDFIKFLTRNLTGVGGVYAIDKLVYDQVDFNSMEYVREDGQRVRLTGLTPIPDLLFFTAMMRGDSEKALAAIGSISIVGANLQGGILSKVIGGWSDMYAGKLSADSLSGEMTQFLASFFPGQGVLTALERLVDTEQRDIREFPAGLLANLPGLSEFSPTYISPTTGETKEQLAVLPKWLGSVEIPDLNIPGVPKKLDAIEKELRELGFSVSRPRRTPLLDFPTPEDVPKEVERKYQMVRGKIVNNLLINLVTSDKYKQLPYNQRREIVSSVLSYATKLAKIALKIQQK